MTPRTPDGTELPRPAAVLFDLDGTLVDTVDNRIEAWLRTLREIGIEADRDRLAGLIGADGKHVARTLAGDAGLELDDTRADDIDRRSGELFGELNAHPQQLRGARDLLMTLDASGVPWAIATSSRAEQVMASVDVLGLPHKPEIVDGSHVERAKPAPDLLLRGAEQLSAPPEGTWYVGDSTWDMQAGRAAGMTAVGVTSGAVSAEALRESGAHAVVASLEELVERFRDTTDTDARTDEPTAARTDRRDEIAPGAVVHDGNGEEVGRVDAVFADYLLVRGGFPPVDVHVPTGAIRSAGQGRVEIDVDKDRVSDGIWDRPPMRPHGGARRDGAGDNPA